MSKHYWAVKTYGEISCPVCANERPELCPPTYQLLHVKIYRYLWLARLRSAWERIRFDDTTTRISLVVKQHDYFWLDEAAQIPDSVWRDIQRAFDEPTVVRQKGVSDAIH